MRHRHSVARRGTVLLLVGSLAVVALLLTSGIGLAGRSDEPSPDLDDTASVTLTPGGASATTPGTSPIAPASPSPTASPISNARPQPTVAPIRDNWPITITASVPFTGLVPCGATRCRLLLDRYTPKGSGPFPVVVLTRGGPSGPGGRGYLAFFAEQLAHAGFIVYNADFRDVATQSGGYPMAFEDVACAIRYARANAGSVGGDGSLTLVGHSLGGWVGSVVALDPVSFGGSCPYGGSGRPDAFVGLAGNYDLNRNLVDLFHFFGSGPAQTAEARAKSDPFNYASGGRIPVRLVAGTSDATVNPQASQKLAAFLAAKSWNVTLTMVPGASHMSTMTASHGESPALRAVRAAAAVAADYRDAAQQVAGSPGR